MQDMNQPGVPPKQTGKKWPYWRFVSPSTLLLALLMFPLPWIHLQCTEVQSSPKSLTRFGVPEQAAEFLTRSERTSLIWLQQSGWQAILGECERNPKWDAEHWQEKLSDDAQNRARAEERERMEHELAMAMHGSWIMAVYAILMVTVVIAGMVMTNGRRRSILLVPMIVVALGLVALQHLYGFPIVQAYRELPWERLDQRVRTPEQLEAEIQHSFRYTRAFWVAQFFTLAGMAILLAEWCAVRSRVSLKRYGVRGAVRHGITPDSAPEGP
jgi:hypothetical protein